MAIIGLYLTEGSLGMLYPPLRELPLPSNAKDIGHNILYYASAEGPQSVHKSLQKIFIELE